MSARLQFMATFGLLCGARLLHAQSDSTSSALACSSSTQGVRVSVGLKDSTLARSALDTTIVMQITDRTWTRENLHAGVAMGTNGTAGSRSAPWSVCTGASASLGRVTASLHGVYGQIHLRIDPSALRALGNPTAAPTRK